MAVYVLLSIALPGVSAAIPGTAITGVTVNTNDVTISYTLSNTASSIVRFNIADSGGNVVRTLSQSGVSAGSHSIVWDCKDSSGNRVPTGTYTITLMATGTIIGSSTETLHDFYVDSGGMIFVTAATKVGDICVGGIIEYDSTANPLGLIGSGWEVPWGITMRGTTTYSSGGSVYVTDYNKHNLTILNNGGVQKTVNLGFEPKCVAVNNSGYIFIAGFDTNTVHVLDPDGNSAYQFYVSNPESLCIDSSDNIYVIDSYNDRLHIFTPSSSLTGSSIRTIGGTGSGNYQFNHPMGVAVYNGKIYVADSSNSRFQVYDSNTYSYLQTYLLTGTSGESVNPYYVHVDSNENMYMSTAHSLHGIYATSSASFTTQDVVPPTVNCVTNVTEHNGWYHSDVELTVSATDDYSGVKSFNTSWDNHSFMDFPVKFLPLLSVISGEVNKTLYWQCMDNASNVAYGNKTIKIDRTKPEIYGSPDRAANVYGWYNDSVIIHFTASDALSGLYFVSPDINVNYEGIRTHGGQAEDIAGNTNTTYVTVRIDKTAPVISGGPISAANSDGWYNHPVQVNFTATDAHSGVASITPNVTLGMEGSGQSASCTAVDYAGNSASMEVAGIDIDLTAPQTLGGLSGATGSGGIYVGDVTLTLSSSDGLSGVKTTEYSTDGSIWVTYGGPVTFSSEGTITVYYRSVDNADNVESTKSVTFSLDRTAPVSSAALSGTMGSNDWYVSNVVVTITAADDGSSGVGATEYSLDGSAWQPYTAPVTVSADGATTMYYMSVDNAGNVEAAKQVSFKIDKTLPAITGTLSGSRSSLGWFEGDASLSLSYSDAMSGVSRVMYSLDGSAWYVYTGAVTIPKAGSHDVYYGVIDNAGNRKNGTSHVYFPPASVQYLWSVISPSATPAPTPTPVATPVVTLIPSQGPEVTTTPEITPTPGPTTTAQTQPGSNWWLYLLGLLVVGIGGSGAYFLFLRK